MEASAIETIEHKGENWVRSVEYRELHTELQKLTQKKDKVTANHEIILAALRINETIINGLFGNEVVVDKLRKSD